MTYKPPFRITSETLKLVSSISHTLGMLQGERIDSQPLKLRRESNIRTIHASLSIEGNTLSLDQVTDILSGKRVIGPLKDIVEVKNAMRVYESFDKLKPSSIRDFLDAHRVLMKDLIDNAGEWRSGSVGIFKGKAVAHVAPQAKRVPNLMKDLFKFLKSDVDTSWLLKSCIFHYELEFIHPFMDGNGRMGRLWQQVILASESEIFKTLSVEELIKSSQAEYYEVLRACDLEGESTQFIEYALRQILASLKSYRDVTRVIPMNPLSRLEYARKILGSQIFSRKSYLNIFKDISTTTASRDLLLGSEQKILSKSGVVNQVKYRFVQ